MNPDIHTHTFHVSGMHCKACVLLVDSELKDIDGVESVHSDLDTRTVVVNGNFGEKSAEAIAEELSGLVTKHGYTISIEAEVMNSKKTSDFAIAIPIALAFIVGFLALQKLGLVNLITSGNVTYGTAFVIGIVASLSTCVAVVGGLVLSMSATFAKEGDMVRPAIMFHIGRLLSFFLLGGIIGAIGSAFQLNGTWSFVLSVTVGVVMLLMGLNLLDTFHFAKKLQPSMPRFLASRALAVSKMSHMVTPFLVGIATFFLPCGFTQAMQIYTLSAGSFWNGGLTMLSFALGTLPVLALISFSSVGLGKGKKASVFFKTAGLIVIVFALFNLVNGLSAIGIIPPIFTF
ncbi:MAG: sulfite exporter TauE/SafE family protein [Patescibacteria group bacterium]